MIEMKRKKEEKNKDFPGESSFFLNFPLQALPRTSPPGPLTRKMKNKWWWQRGIHDGQHDYWIMREERNDEPTKPEMMNKWWWKWRTNPRMKMKTKTEMKIQWWNNYSEFYKLCMPQNLISLSTKPQAPNPKTKAGETKLWVRHRHLCSPSHIR